MVLHANIHLFTLRDFEVYCATHSVRILERLVMDGAKPVNVLPNLRGSLAVFRFDSGSRA